MKKLFATLATVTTVAITISLTSAHAGRANDVYREIAVKMTLHQMVCGGQSERMKNITVKAIVNAGGVDKIVGDVVRLKANIKREGDLDMWCKIMDKQIERVEMATDLIKE